MIFRGRPCSDLDAIKLGPRVARARVMFTPRESFVGRVELIYVCSGE